MRDLGKKTDVGFTVGHYLESLPQLAQQFTTTNYTDPKLQRLYLKDIDCPSEWRNSLDKLIPPALFYLNESPKPFIGPGSRRSQIPEYPRTPEGKPIARAGDLMSSLPAEMRAENLMCYIGHEGTYTPAHQEMCASLGHNLMVEASDGSLEDQKNTTPGSSVWFMTETKDRHVLSEYWMSVLGHDIDVEDHFAQIKAWAAAPWKTYVVEQRPGDLILVPPLAAHQVWNRGTRTMKVAWNRTTVETLELALNEALPHARMVCRDEQYKNKAIIFYTLERYSYLLRHAPGKDSHPEVQELWEDFKDLFRLYTDILLSESFSRNPSVQSNIELIKFDGNVTCSYCRCDIFNRFLACPWCKTDDDDTYDVCMECYMLGRSCGCISRLNWVEQFPWKDLTDRHETWRRQIVSRYQENKALKAQYPVLAVARLAKSGRKSVADICQDQMRLRPWVDSSKPPEAKAKTASDIEGDDNGDDDGSDGGRARKRRKTLRDKRLPEGVGRCHICRGRELNWKMVTCSSCQLKYCYGILFRAFDILPQEAMEKSHWVCPKCRKICSCPPCRQDPTMRPHEPRRILLGHNTRKFADPRSTESLVNMSLSNQKWLNLFGADSAHRLEKRRQEAQTKRQTTLDENSILVEPIPQASPNGGDQQELYEDNLQDIPVDPALELSPSFLSPEADFSGR